MYYDFARRLRPAALLCSVAALAACVPSARAPQPAPPAARAPVQRPVPAPPPPAPVSYTNPAAERPAPGLVAEIDELWRGFPGTTGIAVRRIDGDWSFGMRKDELFPQQSVSKTWVTLTILDEVDQGKLKLSDPVTITTDDLAVFHQPIRDRVLANGSITETVYNLIQEAITHSDNTANDALLWKSGGPDAVNGFIARKGLGAIRFGPGERLLQSRIAGLTWNQDYAIGSRFFAARAELPVETRRAALYDYLRDPIDGASPQAIVDALAMLARGELLSPESTQLMLETMSRTHSGPNRLKAGVPAGWQFKHKTGTGQELGGIATGYNDIGIMTAPDGTRYAVAVMLGDTTASIPDRMRLMQGVSRAVARYHGI
ncbi:serine hydrolase [Novosphingopyxis sp.]|uniref:serine hydrolase n=1 Tax=Novosphingopyxis sp. TaxID=2709690 RepID=UPI003B59EC4B